jgi:hypothetical protein
MQYQFLNMEDLTHTKEFQQAPNPQNEKPLKKQGNEVIKAGTRVKFTITFVKPATAAQMPE